MSKNNSAQHYEDYQSDHLELSDNKRDWKRLLFSCYSHPQHLDGCPCPATKNHLLTFANNGAVKGEYAINSNKWKPYTWRQGEWLIGQSSKNSCDSRWDSLCEDNVEISVGNLQLVPEILTKVALEVSARSPDQIEIPHRMSVVDPFMFQSGLLFKAEAENGSPFCPIFVEATANLLVVHLIKNYCTQLFRIREYRPNRSSAVINWVLDCIDCALDRALSLSSMAQLAHMSVYHIACLFKQAVGVTLQPYVLKFEWKNSSLHGNIKWRNDYAN